ncbi:hypothetical protein EV199_0904 [Pseudobacter ginsenosidimutans]|uniref:Uncharacterized protein n=2 Tax=Pseudobacter ginsenosidimutans TaxID=661488 RepID=A0A4V2F1V0_9BACT|nr:hypothetical protein EV199_0904 [Pseudobacter ginsenosidimutans]
MAATLTLLSACSKSGDDQMPSGNYVSSKILIAGVKMYTGNGEVTDQSLINRYIASRDLQRFFKSAQTEEPETGLVTISLEPGKATVKYPGQPMTMEMSYRQTGNGRYLLNWVGKTLWQMPNPNFRCMQMGDSILQYPVNKLNIVSIPDAGGYSTFYTPSFDYVLNVKAGTLTAPFLSYAFSNDNHPYSACSSANGDVWNMFNPGCLARLRNGDTLVVQSKTVLLKKQ